MNVLFIIAALTLTSLIAPEAWSAPTAPPPAALKVTTSVTSERSPWPERTLVMLWLEGGEGRIYPLPLLDRHGVLLDAQRGRRVAATWSPMSGSAMLVALPGDIQVRSGATAAGGWRRVEDPASKSAWLPGKAQAVTGPAKEHLEPVAESIVLPMRRALQLAPDAEVIISAEPPATLNKHWQETRKQVLIPSLKRRLTVVMARGQAAAWRHGALPRDGVIETTIGGLKVLVVRAHHITRAYMAPLTQTLNVAVDPWTGAPLLWTDGVGLWNGLSGARVGLTQNATQPLPTLELSEEAYTHHWPKGLIHDPSRAAQPSK